MKKIQWNKVTWYSKLVAVLVFIIIFAWAFHLGRLYEQVFEADSATLLTSTPAWSSINAINESLINNVGLQCDANKTIQAQFMENNIGQGSVALELSDGRSMILPQTISADGARYAKPDESFVFWNKGNTSFVQEGAPYGTSSTMTYSNCATIQ